MKHLFSLLLPLFLLSSCGGGSSSSTRDTTAPEFRLVPAGAASTVLYLKTTQMSLTVVCIPYRDGDFSGELKEGNVSLHLEDSTHALSSLQGSHLTGEWMHMNSSSPGHIPQLRLELRGTSDTGEPISILLEGLELRAEKMPTSSEEQYQGRLEEGLLVVPGQLQLSLSGGGIFTLLPQST